MVAYPNFYENINEACMRLRGTIVMYDCEPYYILTICGHLDGKFRVYMTPIEGVMNMHIPCLNTLPHPHPSMAAQLDQYVNGDINGGVKVIRKQMDSPKFNKFRPFALGMMNHKGAAIYCERKPLRPKTEQGLTPTMVEGTKLSACMASDGSPKVPVGCYTSEFRDCILGDYPGPKQCLEGLKGDNVNYSVGFSRNFALVRGPIDTFFLAYKTDVVGALTRSDFSVLRLGKKFKHLKEVCQELNLFVNIE